MHYHCSYKQRLVFLRASPNKEGQKCNLKDATYNKQVLKSSWHWIVPIFRIANCIDLKPQKNSNNQVPRSNRLEAPLGSYLKWKQAVLALLFSIDFEGSGSKILEQKPSLNRLYSIPQESKMVRKEGAFSIHRKSIKNHSFLVSRRNNPESKSRLHKAWKGCFLREEEGAFEE